MCPNLLECFLIPSISVGAVHNSKWTNEKSQQPTYGMCPLMKITHIIRDLPGHVDTFCGGDWKWPTLSPQLLCVTQRVNPTVGESGGILWSFKPSQPNPTPHCHHGVAFNGHWKWQYWAQNVRINPLRPIPPANDNTNQGESNLSVSVKRTGKGLEIWWGGTDRFKLCRNNFLHS